MHSVISCDNLCKNYGGKRVLKGINLEIPAGSITALLGTNGAGKTTLIRTILGLIPSSGGAVKVLGEEPYKIGPDLRQHIGYVSEEQGLYGWMKVGEIIDFCKALYSQWDDSTVQKYLQCFKLSLKTRIGALSKGQTTKLALLLALAPKPKLLILDEPMSGLDPLAQYQFLQVILKEIDNGETTIFFSTHNLSDVEAVAKQVAFVDDGKIKAFGTIPEVCAKVIKITFSGKLPDCGEIIILDQDLTGKTALIPSALREEIAVTAETVIIKDESVTLREAFLYFCSGGKY